MLDEIIEGFIRFVFRFFIYEFLFETVFFNIGKYVTRFFTFGKFPQADNAENYDVLFSVLGIIYLVATAVVVSSVINLPA